MQRGGLLWICPPKGTLEDPQKKDVHGKKKGDGDALVPPYLRALCAMNGLLRHDHFRRCLDGFTDPALSTIISCSIFS